MTNYAENQFTPMGSYTFSCPSMVRAILFYFLLKSVTFKDTQSNKSELTLKNNVNTQVQYTHFIKQPIIKVVICNISQQYVDLTDIWA